MCFLRLTNKPRKICVQQNLFCVIYLADHFIKFDPVFSTKIKMVESYPNSTDYPSHWIQFLKIYLNSSYNFSTLF